jgi:transposase
MNWHWTQAVSEVAKNRCMENSNPERLFTEAEMANAIGPGVEGTNGCEARPKPRFKPINRQQLIMRTLDVERLVAVDHPVRAIWEMMGEVDLSGFEKEIRAVEGRAGQATLEPRLLGSLWVYAYSEGISSARELSRMTEHDAGCQWLTGMSTVNHHTLSDFRVDFKAGLDGLFVQVLGLLSAAGLIELKQVMQDGTKIKANAGKDTFRREQRLREHLQLAEKQIREMGDPRSDAISQRVAKARERALREKKEKLEVALEELKKVRQTKAEKEASETRTSTSDPQARIMKNSDGGFVPAYNVQISTDAAHGIVLDVQAVQAAADWDQLIPGVERIEQNVGTMSQMIVDAGYTNRENIVAMAERQIELIGPGPQKPMNRQRYDERGIADGFHADAFRYDEEAKHYVCPSGKILRLTTRERHAGRIKFKYQARPSDCQSCPFREQCCPKSRSRRITRSEDSETVKAFIARMESEPAKQIYRKRAGVAEFVNAWLKDKIGLRQFRLRGLVKVQAECVWAVLTYNIQQWIRLCWRRQFIAA